MTFANEDAQQYPIGNSGRYVLRTKEPLKPWDEAALARDLSTDEDVEAALRFGEALGDLMAKATASIDAICIDVLGEDTQ